MGRTCVNAQAELKTCKSDLEKARVVNDDMVMCACCTPRHETKRFLLRNVAMEQCLTPLIPRLFLVQEKGIAGYIYGASKRKRMHV